MEKKEDNDIAKNKGVDDLILYCKLLKYLRTTSTRTRKVYTSIVKNTCIPYVTRSAWTGELCFGLEHHPIYGYNMTVLFETLKYVRL